MFEKLIATDISSGMLAMLKTRIARLDLENVIVLAGTRLRTACDRNRKC